MHAATLPGPDNNTSANLNTCILWVDGGGLEHCVSFYQPLLHRLI